MNKAQKTAYNWITNTMILGKEYILTEDQIEAVKSIWEELHEQDIWLSLHENKLVKFKQI